MRKSTILTAATLLALSAGPAAAVEVLRGGEPAASSPVDVLRGQAATPQATAPQPAAPRLSLPSRPAVVAAAGERLWLYNRRSGEVLVCRLRKTTQVGGYRIACHRRDLY